MMTPTIAQIDAAIDWIRRTDLPSSDPNVAFAENIDIDTEETIKFALHALRLLVDAQDKDSDIIKAGTSAAGFVGAEFKTVETWDAMRSKLLEKAGG